MNITLFIFLLFCLQFLYWFVGKRATKSISNQEDYFLAGKSVQFFPLMMTFFATQVGGGLILGAAEEAYKFGWPVLLYPLGATLGLILLGTGVGKTLSQFRVSTVAHLFEIVYDSIMLRRIASFLSILSLFMILVGQIIASNKFLISCGFSSVFVFIAFWSIVIIYTSQGGLKAVISTDIVQALFFSFVFLGCFGMVLFTEASITSMQMPQMGDFAPVSMKLCGWLLMPLLFMIIEQDMGQRCFAGASPKIVSRASFMAGLCTMIVCIVPVFLGSLARNLEIDVPQGGSILIATIAKTTTPWMTSLVACAVLAAIISTATSLINAISSNISSDFEFLFVQCKNKMSTIKKITCAIAVGAIFCTFYFDSIVDVLIQSYELSVSCLFIPLFAALFKKKGNFISALLSIILGTVGFCLFRIYPIEFPREIASIILSTLGYATGEIIARTYTIPAKEGLYYEK